MNNKGVGAIFCLAASILMAARYLSAAMFMSGITGGWNSDLFRAGLGYIGPALNWAAIIALVVGVVFLGVGIYQDVKDSAKK